MPYMGRGLLMVILELHYPGAGVVARSYQTRDCIEFLHSCIEREQQKASSLKKLDHTSAALLAAEVHRLEELLSILTLTNKTGRGGH